MDRVGYLSILSDYGAYGRWKKGEISERAVLSASRPLDADPLSIEA